MKTLIAFFMLFSLSLAQAQSIESQFTPSEDKYDQTGLYMQNNCYTDVFVAIRHLNVRNEMESRGFWRIFPGQIVYLNEIQDRNYLLYAYTSDNRISWRGAYSLPLDGRVYPALLVQLPPARGGDWKTVLYCR